MKRISPATVTFTVMAIVLGLVAAYVVRQALEKPPLAKAPEPQPDPGVRVVFAAQNIPKNTRITEDDVFVSHVAKDAKAADGTIKSTPVVVGRITSQTIKAGQAMRDEYLLGIGETLPDLAERLPEGLRAVTIDVVGTETGGKRLEEGDHVDISLTVEGTHPDLGEVTTKTLLQDVLIVDALESRPRQRGTRRASGILTEGLTVAVAPEDANKLIVAQRTGVLSVALRSTMDIAKSDDTTHEISRRELLGLREIPAPKPAKRFTIEKYSGGRLQVLEFDGERIRESREGPSGKRFENDELPQPVAAPNAAGDQSAFVPSGVIEPAAVSFEPAAN